VNVAGQADDTLPRFFMRGITAVSWRENDAGNSHVQKDDPEDGQTIVDTIISAAVKPLWPNLFLLRFFH